MRAIVRDDYGPASVLQLEDIERPPLGDDQVLIKVRASSMNAGDRLMMLGEPYALRLVTGLRRPKSRGMGQDVAGVVEAVGAGVTDWVVGDEVFGEVTFGHTWAEYAVAPAKVLARKPSGLSFEEAASLPVAAVTALQAVRHEGRIEPGQTVLVNGGSGSVGSYAVQLARIAGGVVTAVCGAAHADRARELGASEVIDYRTQDYTRLDRTWDVILDVAGSRTLAQNRRVLSERGTYVSVGASIDNPWLGPIPRFVYMALVGLFSKQRIAILVASPGREHLTALTELVDRGSLVPAFEERCTLDEVPRLMTASENGKTRGKVVVSVA